MSPNTKICAVCGDKSLGYNFNAVTCESCKAFFRRNALSNKEFTCPFSENCEITVVTRRFCQKCRLEKCFKIGMKKEFIMSEEDKNLKRKKIEQNRAKKRNNSTSAGNSNNKSSKLSAENDIGDGDSEDQSYNLRIKIKKENDTDAPHKTSDNNNLYQSNLITNSTTSPSSDYNSSSTTPNTLSPDYSHQNQSINTSTTFKDILHSEEKFRANSLTIDSDASDIVDSIVNDLQVSLVITTIMKTPRDAVTVMAKVINSPSNALRLISHFITKPGDALMIISKIMNSPLDALTVFTQFMSSPTDALQIISKIISSPSDVLLFMKQLMHNPENAIGIMHKFMNSPAEALQIINRMMNHSNANKPTVAADTSTSVTTSPGTTADKSPSNDDLSLSDDNTNIELKNTLTKLIVNSNPPITDSILINLKDSPSSSTRSPPPPTQSCTPLSEPAGSPDTEEFELNNPSSIEGEPSAADLSPEDEDLNEEVEAVEEEEETTNVQEGTKHDLFQKTLTCESSTTTISNYNSYNGNGGHDLTYEILGDIENTVVQPNSIESILCEAIKLEYDNNNVLSSSSNRELNDSERAKLNELIVANKALYAPVDEDLSSLISDDCRIKTNQTNEDPLLLKVINLTAIAIRRLIKMSKKISSFKNMCQEDQVALLKGGCTEMMILRSVMQYDCDRATWKIPHSQEAMSNLKADVLKLAKGNVYQEHERFIMTFDQKWRMDENIILIMCAIILFTPNRPKTVHSDVIKLEQNSYYYLLRRYLESIYQGCEAKSTFLKLMQKISELHKLNDEIISVYLDVNPSQVEPLLREIFDLKVH